MAGYTRQSSFADGDTITAALFNDEYNQLVNAFSNTTGHSHDGTAASGPVIGLIGDAGETSPNNKVLIDTTNNYIEFYVEVSSSPVQQLYIADGAIVPVTDSDVDLGTSSLYFKNSYIDTVTTTGNVSVGGNLTVTGNATIAGNLTFGDAASDTVAFSADVASNLLPSADNTYDIGASGSEWKDIYIDGTAYVDAINFNGTAITATAAELNIMDGVTATAAEINALDGITSTVSELNILDGVTATAAEINVLDGITSTVAELNILDGVTASATDINLIDGITNGTVIASKAIITDANKDISGGRNITISGELDAATLDISGDADIDGTLEADAITIGGTTLAETISDTVGAMVSSNTETNITVTYEDSDNTLDFVIGTLNQDTTGTADNITVSANNSTDETVYPIFVDGATGSQGAESDTGLTYNPSSGVLTSTSFTGNLTGNVTGNTSGTAATVTGAAQSNITSLGTLTTLTVDNVIINGTTIGHTSDTDLITLADGNVTIAGELDLTTLDVSGDADIDGTLEADAITVGGTALASVIAGTTVSNATLASTVTVSDSTANTNFPVVFHDESNALLDDTGALRYNPSTGELLVPKLTVAGTTTTADTVTMQASNAIVFEGATADSNETTLSIVDPTSDHTQYLINQGGYIPVLAAATTTAITATPAELNILDGVTSTAAELNILDGVTSTAAELNILDGATVVVGEINALDLGSTAVGTAIASKAVILDSNKDYTGLRNLTITGELDAATLDISGDVDIDGTLETDNLTVGGAQGSDGQVLTSTGSGVAWENASSGAVTAINNATANELVTIGSTTTELDAEANLVFDGTNLGIGTASPSTNLHIYSTADNAPHLLLENFQNADTDDAPVIELYLNDQTTGGIGDNTDVGVIRFTGDEKDGGTKETYAEIRGVAHDPGQGSSNKGNLSFFVQAAGDLNETLTLDEKNVGIGTTSPDHNLVVRGSANTNDNIFKVEDSDGTSMAAMQQDSSGNGRWIVYDTSGNADVLIHTAGNSYFNGGNVGIGNTLGSFHSSVLPFIVGSGSGDEGMAIYSGSSNKGKLGFADAATDDSGSYRGYLQYDHSGDNLNIGTAGSERVRIDSSGKVGIGNTTPGNSHSNANMLVVGSGSAGGMALYNGANDGGYYFARDNANNTDAYDGGMSYNADRDLQFRTNAGTVRMTIDGSGNVGIGTDSPAEPLHIVDSGSSGVTPRAGTIAFFEDDAAARITMGSANDNDCVIHFGDDGDNDIGGITYSHGGDRMEFRVNAAERLRITSTGQLLLGATAAVDSEQMLVNRNGSCKMTIRAEEDSSARDALFSLHTRNTGAQCRINFVDGSGAGTGAGQIYYNHDGNSLRFLTDSTEHFIIDGSGNLTATDTTIGNISDKRLKTNIQDYTYSIDDFKSYTPRIFDWINPEEHANKSQQIGFIAQEQEVIDNRFIEEVETSAERKDTKLLDTITKKDGDVVGISKTSKFGQKDAMYISVIQQLITRLETAEEKIAALENN